MVKDNTTLQTLENEKLIERTNDIDRFMNERVLVFLKKNKDYGNSFLTSYQKYGNVSALVRMEDKVNRFLSLRNADNEVLDESIQDTLLDLFNYMMMYQCAKELTPGVGIGLPLLIKRVCEESVNIYDKCYEDCIILGVLTNEMGFSQGLAEDIIDIMSDTMRG